MTKRNNLQIQNVRVSNHQQQKPLPISSQTYLKNVVQQSQGEFNNQKQIIAKYIEDSDELGQIIRLAYYSSNQEVHIDQQTLYLLQKYSANQVCFIGFIGSNSSCTSFVLDTILSISSIGGNHFTNVYDASDHPGLYIWSLPYSYNSKLKTFIIQCRGVSFSNEMTNRNDQILIDLLMILCSTVVVVSTPLSHTKKKIPIFGNQSKQRKRKLGQFQELIINQFYKSTERVSIDGCQTKKQDNYWPFSFCFFHAQKTNHMKIENIETCFNHCRYIYLEDPFSFEGQSKQNLYLSLNQNLRNTNPAFVKRVSNSFIDLIQAINCKSYQGLKFTGNVLCKLLINTVKYMNKKSRIKIDKIFASIFKQIYEASLYYHCDIYENQLKQRFNQQQPFLFDLLLDSFSECSNKVLTSFNEAVINETVHQQYQSRLLDFIEQKQRLLIQINFKKTKLLLEHRMKQVNNKTNFDIGNIKVYISEMYYLLEEYDHDTVQFLSLNLLKFTKNFEKRIIQEKIKLQKQRINQLRQQSKGLKEQYNQEKQENLKARKVNQQNQKNNKKLHKSIAQLQVKVKGIKKDIQYEKKFQKQYMISKQSKKDLAQGLLQMLRQLQQKSRDNIRQMEEINKQFDYHPDILNLNKKLQEKQRQIKQFEKIQSRIEIQSRNSVLRSAIQKPKQAPQKRPIKRLSVKR